MCLGCQKWTINYWEERNRAQEVKHCAFSSKDLH
jgi:hypothetical protein